MDKEHEYPLNDDPGFEEDADPGEATPLDDDLVDLDVEFGRVCARCGRSFEEEHGQPAACPSCFEQMDQEERGDTILATHPLVEE